MTFAATAGRRFRTVQATFKVISFWRDRGAFVTLCFQYLLTYLLTCITLLQVSFSIFKRGRLSDVENDAKCHTF